MEEDFDDDLAEEGLPTGHDAVAPGKGILLLPHRQLHPHSQLLKARPSVDQEPRLAILPPHATHSHLGGQDHGDWTYEEQFRQVGCPRIFLCAPPPPLLSLPEGVLNSQHNSTLPLVVFTVGGEPHQLNP